MSVTKPLRMRLGRVSAVDGLNGRDCKCYFVQGGQWATAIVRIAGSPASRCGGRDGAAVRAERCQCRYCQPSSQVQPPARESRKVLLSFMIHALQAYPKTSPAMKVVSKVILLIAWLRCTELVNVAYPLFGTPPVRHPKITTLLFLSSNFYYKYLDESVTFGFTFF
ncbi:hypothetical protein M0657_012283 [Pyricularia oryzae]|nr:hypothetical protein M0657_012283 [Pyricularia oryzae]